ncbi:hypothetical protein CEXT_698921, partial [Caerostris extrusa]
MLKSLEHLQAGLCSPRSFRTSLATSRVFDLNLSPFTTFESAHISVVTSLDLDRVEDR